MPDRETHRKTCKRWNTPWDDHELTFSCFKRRAFLSKDRPRFLLAEAVIRAKTAMNFHLWAYVIMPEHAHLLIWPADETYSISAILRAVKQPAARRAISWLRANNPAGLKSLSTGISGQPYRFWQAGGGHDRNIRDSRTLRNVFNYIHHNPVNRGLVSRPEDWLWSSAADWDGLRTGPIPVDKESFLRSNE